MMSVIVLVYAPTSYVSYTKITRKSISVKAISLNRLFDYRLDVVKLRVARQSTWRLWFVQFPIPLLQCQTGCPLN